MPSARGKLLQELQAGHDVKGAILTAILKIAVCLVLFASVARAANTGTADPALLLDAIPTYGTEPEARAACGKDKVVWADRYVGYYYLPGEKQFATTQNGAFSCQQAAAKGNYWDTNPLSSMSGHPGRNFPYQPLYVGS